MTSASGGPSSASRAAPDGCAPGATPTSSAAGTGVPAGEVRVVLGLHSGRPDPALTLTDAQVVALDGVLAGLLDSGDVPPSGGLGYHGFTLTRPGQTLTAYLGVVMWQGAVAPS